MHVKIKNDDAIITHAKRPKLEGVALPAAYLLSTKEHGHIMPFLEHNGYVYGMKASSLEGFEDVGPFKYSKDRMMILKNNQWKYVKKMN